MRSYLHTCLLALQAATDPSRTEIIVIDNASADGTVDLLEPLFPGIRFVRNTHNTGFAVANNQGLALAGGEYVLLLNPDTLVTRESLSHSMRLLASSEKTAAVGVRMINGYGLFLPESKRSLPDFWGACCKLTGLAALFPRSAFFNRYALGHLDALSEYPVAVLAGAYMMLRRDALQQVGGLDEGFFMYGEDIDLCRRLQDAGYDIWYIGKTPILHFKGKSSRKGSMVQVKLFYAAMARYVRKYHHFPWLTLPLVYLREALALCWHLIPLHPKSEPVLEEQNSCYLGHPDSLASWLHFAGIRQCATISGLLTDTEIVENVKKQRPKHLIINLETFPIERVLPLMQVFPGMNTCFFVPSRQLFTGNGRFPQKHL